MPDILDLSDLHFHVGIDVDTLFAQLSEDLRIDLKCEQLDAIILSGDLTDRAEKKEFDLAYEFTQKLITTFRVARQNLLIVPGNHDVDWTVSQNGFKQVERKAFTDRVDAEYVYEKEKRKGKYLFVCDEGEYRKRLKNFADFYKRICDEEYSLDYDFQFSVLSFAKENLILAGLNSAWCLDHLRPGLPSIRAGAVNRMLKKIESIPEAGRCHKIAVWHHPIQSSAEDRIHDDGFAQRLAKFGFRIGIHGHVHEMGTSALRYELGGQGRRMEIIAAGTFGAPTKQLPTGTPWEYNLLRFNDDKLTVESRYRSKLEVPWRPYAAWPEGPTSASARYTIALRPTPKRINQLYSYEQLMTYLKEEGIGSLGYRIAVEANIFDNKGRLLLQKRGPKARDERGKFEGIGGHLKQDTDLHACLRKEIREEIGEDAVVNIDALFEVRPVVFIEDHGPEDWIVVSYLCYLDSGEPRVVNAGKTEVLKFFSLEEAYALKDEQLSRSTSRFLMLYKAKYGHRPYRETFE
jgi:8-oxo-dGTP pyrophosphatase MutT (NUDIX family)